MNQPETLDLTQALAPGLFRRLAAMFYDSLLLLGVLMAATALAMLVVGEGPNRQIESDNQLIFRIYLLVIGIAFFIWFWTHGGQTLGMRVWRIRLLRMDGTGLSIKDGLVRCLAALLSTACLGLGFLWILVDKEKLAWHDRLSGTRMVITAKRQT
jgi:uncharacterized RDD family membrane protein YckC